MYVHMYICEHKWKLENNHRWYLQEHHLPLPRWGLSLAWNSPIRVDQLATMPFCLGLLCFCLPSCWAYKGITPWPPFVTEFCGLNSGPCGCKGNALHLSFYWHVLFAQSNKIHKDIFILCFMYFSHIHPLTSLSPSFPSHYSQWSLQSHFYHVLYTNAVLCINLQSKPTNERKHGAHAFLSQLILLQVIMVICIHFPEMT